MIERRKEARVRTSTPIRVWGIDINGRSFNQDARVRDVSRSGALVCDLEAELRSGDLVGVIYSGKRCRFRIVWIRPSGAKGEIQAAIHRVSGDECPWPDLLDESLATHGIAADSAGNL